MRAGVSGRGVMKKFLIVVGAIVGVGIFLANLGGSGSVAGTYVASGEDSSTSVFGVTQSSMKVAFLSLTQNGSTLSGTMDIAQLPTGYAQVYTGVEDVSGTYANGRITLTVGTSTGPMSMSGTVQNGNLVFPAQVANGTVGYTEYERGTAVQYNGLVDQLDAQAQANAVTNPPVPES